MKKGVILFVASLLFVFFAAVGVLTQEQRELRTITVRSNAVNNGVVILVAQEGRNSFELQCTKNVFGCTVLEPGNYLMARLPKDHGIYECANADIYRTTTDSKLGNKIGQYCLVEEK
jgi:hypothetical protein